MATDPADSEQTTRNNPMHGQVAPLRLERGAALGRYLILDRRGEGAMGAVYAAYDPELDRSVAVKLLHHDTPEMSERLVREGQAMARLSHPNIVAVHDAGTVRGCVFIAMELVDGTTLKEWSRER